MSRLAVALRNTGDYIAAMQYQKDVVIMLTDIVC